MDYLDFDLEIGEGTGREYPVTVLRSPAGEARATMRFPYDELALENRLLTLQNALLRSGGKLRSVLSPEQQAVRDFGRALFDALIAGEVRSRYDVSLERAHQAGQGLRLRLRFQSPALAALPWEFLYDDREAEYVCLKTSTPLVRYLELQSPPGALAVAPPLRVLGVAASPDDLAPLNVDNEKQRIETALKAMQEDGRVKLSWLAEPSWQGIQRALQEEKWHILHFVCHGEFDPTDDEGLIYLADEKGKAQRLTATQLSRLLADHYSMRLVVLNACESAKGSEKDTFSSTASILVRGGPPAVLAMQYEITDQAAIELARAFYEALANNLPVDAAVAEARKAVSIAVKNTVEWGTPVLTMRAPDGVLFNLEPPANIVSTRIETPTPGEPRRRIGAGSPWLLARLAAIVVVTIAIIAYAAGLIPPTQQSPAPTIPLAGEEGGKETVGAIVDLPTQTPTFVVTPVPTIRSTDTTSSAAGTEATLVSPTATTTAAQPILTTEPHTPTALPGELWFVHNGVIVMEPVYMELVRVPAGEFLMGSDPAKDTLVDDDEKPQHQVTLSEFYIGKHEVTNNQYAEFVKATGPTPPSGWENGSVPAGKEDHPVVNVSWDDAVAFTQWLSRETGMGFRLCTEAEWEKACRGENGLIFPWGDAFDASKANAVESGIGTTTPVGRYSPGGDSPYGVADLAGNVWEWTSSAFKDYPYDPADGRKDTASMDVRVARGGSFSHYEVGARCADRYPDGVGNRHADFGWRVCASPGLSTPGHSVASPVPVKIPPGAPGAASEDVVNESASVPITGSLELELVLVPTGAFVMGIGAYSSEQPRHSVTLPEFWIGKYEVSNAQYGTYVQATGVQAPDRWDNNAVSAENQNHPVVGVSWNDAVAFANWLSARTGKAFRLCTEAEWERACRGKDERTYPWGDDSLDFRRANYGGNEGTTTPIGAYSPQGDSPYGVADMMGNAWEWTASLDSPYPYDPNDGRESMRISGRRVVRGGSFLDNEIYMRCSVRNSYYPDLTVDQFGFRVCTSQ